jgi:tRNA (guanine-N7-)-methyltransferase
MIAAGLYQVMTSKRAIATPPGEPLDQTIPMCARPLSDVLHHYVVPWLQAEWPLNWQMLVDRAAPLVVEVGFGNGLFLIRQAEHNPDVNLVGIELSWGWVQHLARRLDEAGLTHVRLIHGEAQMALQHLFGPNSIGEIFINFPDPWPKKRHHSRRLIQAGLVELLHDRLAPSGQVTIATDHPDYATWIGAILERQTALQPCFSTTAVPELTGRTPTKYEQRARGANLPIYYFVWRKPFGSPPMASVQRGEAVPHVILEGPHDIEKALSTGTSRTWRDSQQGIEVSTTLIRAYRELTNDSWLVELVVKEGKLCQQIGVTLIPRSQEQVLLKLSAMGFPRPTWGVQRAVWHVAQMLQEYNPQLRMLWMSLGTREQVAEGMHERSARRGTSKRPSIASES